MCIRDSQYIASVTKPGRAKIKVSAEGFPSTPYEFRVKRIPDPIARLGNKQGGLIGNGEFKVYDGLDAYLKDFEFEADCKISGFLLTRHKKNDDPISFKNPGAKYNSQSARLVDQAKSGDHYYFDDILAKCPGDERGRKLPSIVFKIK